MIDDTLPRQYARTRRFTAGRPRRLTVTPDGERVLFLRSGSGDDPVQALWSLDVSDGTERLLADPASLDLAGDGTDAIPAEERARRERSRELGAGITAYATDRPARTIVFAFSGRLWLTDLDGAVRELPAAGSVFDPRPDPTGRRIAYVAGGALRVMDADGNGDRVLAEPEAADVGYGLAEFVAAEEMHRERGYWWSPDGERLLVARVDNRPVGLWHVSNPADPAEPPTTLRYPMAGTANADVTLWLIGLDGSRVEVGRDGFEYLTAVRWDRHGLLIVAQERSQKTWRILAVDPDTGATTLVREDSDPVWLEIVPGLPARTDGGALVWSVDEPETRRLLVDGEPVTPDGLQLREVLDVDGDTVLFSGSTEQRETHLYTWSAADGVRQVTSEPGIHHGTLAGGVLATTSDTMSGSETVVGRHVITSHAETPVITPRVEWFDAGELGIRTAVVLPTGYTGGPLPVLLDPYGGPAGRRVIMRRDQYVVPQWFADQGGFAVVIADGRGTPGRSPAWDRTIYGNKADLSLEDQVTALHAAAERYPGLDLDRVVIRGWSYGGFLAALAVLRRPDVFRGAVAGAPVTDQRLYDTHYQEKYLGHPDEMPEAYDRASIIADAPSLSRPLMLIHGLSDDNVLPAHTLRLSAALLAAGRPHTVLPLSGVTHISSTDTTANMLVLQLRFLLDAISA
jgi:dipeptidyl-peptidase 4